MTTKNKIPFFLFIFVNIIFQINSSFLIFPLKSLKKRNINIPYNEQSISQYLEPNFDGEKFVNNWYLETLYTEMTMGNPITTVGTEISKSTTTLSCFVKNQFQKQNNINIFNISKSLSDLKRINKFDEYPDIQWYGEVQDDFYFQFTNNLASYSTEEKKINFKFKVQLDYEAKNEFDFETVSFETMNKTTSFALPIKIDNDYSVNYTTSFIKYFKQNDYISSYDLKFEFYKNPKININKDDDEIGRIIFGRFEELYNHEKYPEKNIYSTKLISVSYSIDYRIYITSSYIENPNTHNTIQITSQNIEFIFDQSLISGVKEYEITMEQEFFNKYENGNMCVKKKVAGSGSLKGTDFIIFECNKNLLIKHKKDFPLLKLYSKDLEFVFEFNYDDLFREYEDKAYFLVIFPLNKKEAMNWEFGRILLEKYNLYFNLDSKILRMYHEKQKPQKKSSKGKVVQIILEILLVIILIGLAFYIGKKLNIKRRIRAQELDDNYDYIGKKNNVELN